MKCQEVNELLVTYLDGEVTPSERTLIQIHLAGCDFCQKEVAALSATQSRISQSLQVRAAQAAPSPQAWSRLQARLARAARPSSSCLPVWLQRLAPGVGHTNQIFEGGLTMKKGFAWATLAALVIAVSTVAFVPSMRAWAQSVLAQFGALIITDAPTWPELVINTPPAPTPVGQPTSTPIAGPLPIMTIEEASDAAGFQVLPPEYIPAGYQLVGRRVDALPAGVFARTTCATESGEEHISISQNRYVPGFESEFPMGDAPTVDVTVRGQPGLWVEGAKLGIQSDGSGGSELYGVNVLIWEEGDDLFFLTSNELALDLEEMLKIADSLVPAEAGKGSTESNP